MLERQKYELLRSELKNARLQAKLLQIDLAERLKKPQSYVSKVESGERKIDLIELAQYCSALDIDTLKFIKNLLNKF